MIDELEALFFGEDVVISGVVIGHSYGSLRIVVYLRGFAFIGFQLTGLYLLIWPLRYGMLQDVDRRRFADEGAGNNLLLLGFGTASKYFELMNPLIRHIFISKIRRSYSRAL